jgi:putative oxidoreductase
MNKVTLIIRLVFGVMLVIFGSNKFIGFLPEPEITGAAATYLGGLAASGFTFKVIGLIEVLVGIALLANKYVPLALILMAPISVNIFLYHVLLDLPNSPVGIAVFAFNLILLFSHKKSYDTLLSA